MTTNQSNRKSLTGLVEGATASSNLDITGNVNMKGFKLFNLGLGTDLQDSTNKTQLDAVVSDVNIIDNSISIIEISLNSIGNNDASFQAIDASLVFLDSSAVQFSLGIASNVVDIANNTTNIATNTSAIATANSNIATNTSNIATNTSNIATNTSAIATANSNISTNTSNIATNTSAIATANSNIATNTSNIATNTSNIATNTSDIATNTSAIATANSNISTNTSNIATNTSAIATANSNIATNTSNIATNTSAIATANGNISTNTSNIATNTSNIATNTTAIAGCLKLDGTNFMTASLNAGTNKIINVVDPTAAQDAATKQYVDDNAGSSLWTESGASIYRQNGLVGIGGDIINTSPNLQLDVSGIFRVAQMETDADDNTQNNKAGFVADGRTGQIYCYNNDNVPSSSSSGPGVGFGVDALTLRQLNRFEDQPKLYTEIYAKQLHRTIKGGSYSQTKQDRSAVWGLAVRNETQQYAGSQYESSILALAYGGGSVTVNNSTGTWNNNGYRFRVHGSMAASGYATISDDRIKYHETDITGALGTLNKLKVQKYQKITESVNQTGKWIPSNENWDSVKNSVDSSGHRLFEYEEEIGFIAQEVKKIPELKFTVSGKEFDEAGDETPLLVNYEDIFVLSIQGIQELDAKRREDNKKFIDLNKRIKILEDKMKNIEAESEKEYIL